MCGICGVLALKGQSPDQAILTRMVEVLHHRGPDDSGVEVSGPCGLGNTRLAIIDLSPAGHMPMRVTYTPSQSRQAESVEAWITYNGEAYNFGEVRSVLKAHRHRFFSNSDSETLLRAYLQYGAQNFIKPFRGMFAMAIWDVAQQKLLLMRDRLGKKPLFYYQDSEWLVFGSEIKALLEHPAVQQRLNQRMIPYYLAYGYPASPETLFEGIQSLPPGYMLIADLSGATPEIELKPYWQAPLPTSESDLRSEDDIAADLLAHLRWAVRMRLISDVPLGAFLSGGLDSAAIVALMAEESRSAVKTFSIGFKNEPSFDETRYARQVATHFVTDHHEFIVEPDVVNLVEELVWHHDQPFGDSSAIPTYLVSKLAREYVTVALTGDGGDEIFAGYDRFRAAMLAKTYDHLPDIAQKAIGGALNLLPESTEYAGIVRQANRFAHAAVLPFSERYLSWVRYVPAPWEIGLVGRAAEQQVQEHYQSLFSLPKPDDDPHIIAQLLSVNLRTYLPDDLLVKADRSSMAVSLEARSPFLDHQLVQFAAAIPSNLKIKRGVSKYILKKALRGILPDRIIDRKKHGFGVPVGAWFKGALSEYVRNVLLGERAAQRGVFPRDTVERLIETHMAGKAELGQALWTLLTFELWMQRYFD